MCGQQLVNAAGEHLHVDLCANTVISSDKYIFPARFPSLKTKYSKMNSSFLLFLFFSFFSFSVLPQFYLLQRHLRSSVNTTQLPKSSPDCWLFVIHPRKLKSGHKFWELIISTQEKVGLKGFQAKAAVVSPSLTRGHSLASIKELTKE